MSLYLPQKCWREKKEKNSFPKLVVAPCVAQIALPWCVPTAQKSLQHINRQGRPAPLIYAHDRLKGPTTPSHVQCTGTTGEDGGGRSRVRVLCPFVLCSVTSCARATASRDAAARGYKQSPGHLSNTHLKETSTSAPLRWAVEREALSQSPLG